MTDMRLVGLRGMAERRHHRRRQAARQWWVRAIRGDDAAIVQARIHDQLAREAAHLLAQLTVAHQVRDILEATSAKEQTR